MHPPSKTFRAPQILTRNLLYAAVTYLSDIFLLTLLILCARYLGAEKFGILSFGIAISAILTLSTNLGLDSLAIRKVVLKSDMVPKLLGSLLIWKALICSIIAVILIIIVYSLKSDPMTRLVTSVLCAAGILKTLNLAMRAVLEARGRYDLESLLALIEKISLLAVGTFILVKGYGIAYIAIAWLGVRGASSVAYLVILSHSVTNIRWRLDLKWIKSFQLEALPYGLALILYGISAQIDILLLSVLTSDIEVGIFSSSMKLYEGLLVLVSIINVVFYPELSRLFIGNREKYYQYYQRVLKYALLLSFPIVGFGILFSHETVMMLFGVGYNTAGDVLAILLLGTVSAFLTSAIFMILRSSGLQKRVMYLCAIGLVIRFVLDLVLIPFLGVIGASYAVVISSVVVLLVALGERSAGGYRIELPLPAVGKVGVVACAIVVVITMVSFLPFLVRVGIGGGLYLVLMSTIGVFDKDEVEGVRGLFPSRFVNALVRVGVMRGI